MSLPVNHKFITKPPFWILGTIWFLFQYFQSIRADCRANSAVVPLVIPEVVFLFPLITCPYIQYLFARQSWIPCLAFQCFCRAGFHTALTTTAEASLYWWSTRQFNVGENGSQSNPWSEPARDKLTMTTHSAQPRSRCDSFVGKVPFDLNRIGTTRSRQQFGSKTSGFDFGC